MLSISEFIFLWPYFVTLFWLCVFVFMYLSSLPVSLAILISQRSLSLSLAGNPGVGTSEALRLPRGEERCRHSRSPPWIVNSQSQPTKESGQTIPAALLFSPTHPPPTRWKINLSGIVHIWVGPALAGTRGMTLLSNRWKKFWKGRLLFRQYWGEHSLASPSYLLILQWNRGNIYTPFHFRWKIRPNNFYGLFYVIKN